MLVLLMGRFKEVELDCSTNNQRLCTILTKAICSRCRHTKPTYRQNRLAVCREECRFFDVFSPHRGVKLFVMTPFLNNYSLLSLYEIVLPQAIYTWVFSFQPWTAQSRLHPFALPLWVLVNGVSILPESSPN